MEPARRGAEPRGPVGTGCAGAWGVVDRAGVEEECAGISLLSGFVVAGGGERLSGGVETVCSSLEVVRKGEALSSNERSRSTPCPKAGKMSRQGTEWLRRIGRVEDSVLSPAVLSCSVRQTAGAESRLRWCFPRQTTVRSTSMSH